MIKVSDTLRLNNGALVHHLTKDMPYMVDQHRVKTG